MRHFKQTVISADVNQELHRALRELLDLVRLGQRKSVDEFWALVVDVANGATSSDEAKRIAANLAYEAHEGIRASSNELELIEGLLSGTPATLAAASGRTSERFEAVPGRDEPGSPPESHERLIEALSTTSEALAGLRAALGAA
ncbi:MAG: hypothetical protein KC731_43260 [Myxococcales bacterium]|nr:hypothetical protein [Myxococcales bacterium]